MNLYDIYDAVIEEFTFPATPDVGTVSATVYYEWGDTVLTGTPTLSSGTTYSFTVAADTYSFGTYRIKWECQVSAVAQYFYTEFRVEGGYSYETDFMAKYPDFNIAEYNGIPFTNAEKLARRIIDTYTGQSFQPIRNKTLTIDGTGRRTLHLPLRLNYFSEVLVADVDYTAAVEIDPTSKYFLRLVAEQDVVDGPITITKFQQDASVSITGDWGWLGVPWQIEQAAELLIIDILDEVRRENFRYGVSRIWQDTNRLEFKPGIHDSTGNVDVDVLLMDFVYWTMDYVS